MVAIGRAFPSPAIGNGGATPVLQQYHEAVIVEAQSVIAAGQHAHQQVIVDAHSAIAAGQHAQQQIIVEARSALEA